MGKIFKVNSAEEMCDLMCGGPEEKILYVDDLHHIGSLLHDERCSLGLTAAEVSICSGVHINTIWRIERNEGIPRLDGIILVAKALGFTEIHFAL